MEIPIKLDDLGVPPFSENTLIEPVIVNVDCCITHTGPRLASCWKAVAEAAEASMQAC